MATALVLCKGYDTPFSYPNADSMYAHSYVGVNEPHEIVVEYHKRAERGPTYYRHPICNVLKYWWSPSEDNH